MRFHKILASCSIVGGILTHLWDSWNHFCDFLGVLLGYFFGGLSEEAPGASDEGDEKEEGERPFILRMFRGLYNMLNTLAAQFVLYLCFMVIFQARRRPTY